MAPLTVKLPDGSDLELPDGATGADAAAAIGPGLAKAALGDQGGRRAARPGRPARATAPRSRSSPTASPEALELIRHDAAHVLAEAVIELWPGTKVSIGPPIADGFYYDFEFPDGVRPSEDDLERIEEAMRAHVAADERFERTDVPAADALERFARGRGALQGRADRGPRARRGRRDRLAVPERALHRPLPRPARPRRRAASARSSSPRSPAPTGAATRAGRC